jgi:plastocyanin
MKSSTAIIGILVVVILAGGAFFLMKGLKNSSPTPDSMNTNQAPVDNSMAPNSMASAAADQTEAQVITYTDTGFSPNSITIKQGSVVKFVNNSQKMMWVASSPHPAHTDYPGFDELTGVAKGESFSFTFDKVGIHKYHNHLSPKDFGSVTVE